MMRGQTFSPDDVWMKRNHEAEDIKSVEMLECPAEMHRQCRCKMLKMWMEE